MYHKMKQPLCLLLAFLAALSMARPALAAGITYMPDVTAQMSDASYWADLQEGSREVILTMDEIRAFNQDTADREGTVVMDLRSSPETFDGLAQNEAIRASSADDADYYLGWTYDGTGAETTQEYYDSMIENCIDPNAAADMPVRYGVAVERTLMRVFPSEQPILDDPNDPDFDYQALSGVRVNEPLLIYTTSTDGKYYLARISCCSGWVPTEDVAVCADKEEWLSAWDLPSEKLLIVCGNKEYTDASISHPETARRMLTTATALELVTDLQPDQLVGNRSPYHNYVVWLPVRRDDGTYEKQMALIPENAQVSVGYLPLTMENIAKVALNCLGDAYGWGGMLDVDDCSGMIRTVYACFGLDIARNGNWQAKMNIEKIDMKNMSLEEKRLILDGMPLGSALCFDGHEMMYLGKVDGKYYVVSTVSSIVSPNTGSVLRTRDVMINTLDVKRGSGKTWLGALNMVFMPCYAKLEGKEYSFPSLQWYHDGVAYCLEEDILPSLDVDDTFGIGQNATRLELARALWAMAGKPASGADLSFADVAEDDAALPAAVWATDTAVVPVGTEGLFSPQDTVTRQEAVTALWRLAKLRSLPVGDTGDPDQDALSWVTGEGILTGDGGKLYLDEPVTREQLAVILYRYSQLPGAAPPTPTATPDADQSAT